MCYQAQNSAKIIEATESVRKWANGRGPGCLNVNCI